jgi:hypothetical protein
MKIAGYKLDSVAVGFPGGSVCHGGLGDDPEACNAIDLAPGVSV